MSCEWINLRVVLISHRESFKLGYNCFHSNMCQKLILWFKIHFYSHNESKHAMITVMCLFSKFVEGAFARDCMFKIVKAKNEQQK